MIFILRIFSLVSFPIVYLKITPSFVLLIVQKRACKSTEKHHPSLFNHRTYYVQLYTYQSWNIVVKCIFIYMLPFSFNVMFLLLLFILNLS